MKSVYKILNVILRGVLVCLIMFGFLKFCCPAFSVLWSRLDEYQMMSLADVRACFVLFNKALICFVGLTWVVHGFFRPNERIVKRGTVYYLLSFFCLALMSQVVLLMLVITQKMTVNCYLHTNIIFYPILFISLTILSFMMMSKERMSIS